MNKRRPTNLVPSHASAKPVGLPWGLVAPLGSPVDNDPTQLPDAKPMWGYVVEENDLHFTIYYEPQEGKRRFYLAEQEDSVHVVIAIEAPTPAPATGRIGEFTVDAHGMLSAPLAGRPIVDGASGRVLPRLEAPPSNGKPPPPPDPVSGAAPPLFVTTGTGSLMVFESEEALNAELPRQFPVLAPHYEAFDRRGLRLELLIGHHPVDDPSRLGNPSDAGARLTVRAAEAEPTHQGRLRDLLAKTFGHPKDVTADSQQATLEDLVDYAGWAGECFRRPPSARRLRLEQAIRRVGFR